MNTIRKRRGRPTVNNPKNLVISTRTTDDVCGMLDTICEREHCTRSMMIEKLIKSKWKGADK